MAVNMLEAWELARSHIKGAQKRQKKAYDRQAGTLTYHVGERVCDFMPGAEATKAYKFARPFYGPYRVVALCETGIEVQPVN